MAAIRWKTVLSSTTLQHDALASLVGRSVEVTVVETPPASRRNFRDFLLSIPNVGEDADFERPVVPVRPDVSWDS